jgi:hypothetical protein
VHLQYHDPALKNLVYARVSSKPKTRHRTRWGLRTLWKGRLSWPTSRSPSSSRTGGGRSPRSRLGGVARSPCVMSDRSVIDQRGDCDYGRDSCTDGWYEQQTLELGAGAVRHEKDRRDGNREQDARLAQRTLQHRRNSDVLCAAPR